MDCSPLKFFVTSAAIARVYDIIGDIHGHAALLKRLLSRMGYQRLHGRWGFPRRERVAVFVGDYIDRGPDIVETVRLVREMVDAGTALAVMGNHEFNAIGWHTEGADGFPLRAHTASHFAQHQKTLAAYAGRQKQLDSDIRWMRSLPLYMENADIRVVHATWDNHLVHRLKERFGDSPQAPLEDERFLLSSFVRPTEEHETAEILLKGREIPLPLGTSYYDKDGNRRRTTRIRWWVTETTEDTTTTETPVFVGHYWLTGNPEPLAPRIACLDYSVARGGLLCAYRYDGKLPLRADHFVCVGPEDI